MTETSAAPSPAVLREELERLIVDDLLGPASGPDEVLPGGKAVRERYLVGMLAPAATTALEPSRVDRTGVAGDPAGGDDTPEEPAAKAALFPSSMGLTFVVDGARAP